MKQVPSLSGYECEFWGQFYHLKHPNRTLLLVFVKFSFPFRYPENIAQIYPLWFRTSGVSISTGFNWSLNLIVTFTFPYLQQVAFQPKCSSKIEIKSCMLTKIGT